MQVSSVEFRFRPELIHDIAFERGRSCVEIAAEFTHWIPTRMDLCDTDLAEYHFLAFLPPGSFMYKYLIDGVWVLDGQHPCVEDGAGNWNHVVFVSSTRSVSSSPTHEKESVVKPAQTRKNTMRASRRSLENDLPCLQIKHHESKSPGLPVDDIERVSLTESKRDMECSLQVSVSNTIEHNLTDNAINKDDGLVSSKNDKNKMNKNESLDPYAFSVDDSCLHDAPLDGIITRSQLYEIASYVSPHPAIREALALAYAILFAKFETQNFPLIQKEFRNTEIITRFNMFDASRYVTQRNVFPRSQSENSIDADSYGVIPVRMQSTLRNDPFFEFRYRLYSIANNTYLNPYILGELSHAARALALWIREAISLIAKVSGDGKDTVMQADPGPLCPKWWEIVPSPPCLDHSPPPLTSSGKRFGTSSIDGSNSSHDRSFRRNIVCAKSESEVIDLAVRHGCSETDAFSSIRAYRAELLCDRIPSLEQIRETSSINQPDPRLESLIRIVYAFLFGNIDVSWKAIQASLLDVSEFQYFLTTYLPPPSILDSTELIRNNPSIARDAPQIRSGPGSRRRISKSPSSKPGRARSVSPSRKNPSSFSQTLLLHIWTLFHNHQLGVEPDTHPELCIPWSYWIERTLNLCKELFGSSFLKERSDLSCSSMRASVPIVERDRRNHSPLQSKRISRSLSTSPAKRRSLPDPGSELDALQKRGILVGAECVIPVSYSVGIIRFLGRIPTLGVDSIIAGLELQSSEGDSDGSFQGERYFSCPPDHGTFAVASSLFPYWKSSSSPTR